MKAKEYFHKYHEALKSSDADDKAMYDLMLEFNHEAKELIEKRNAKRNGAIIAVLKEQNAKWNKLADIYEKTEGYPLLKKDGFIDLCKHRMPTLAMLPDMERQVKEFQKEHPDV